MEKIVRTPAKKTGKTVKKTAKLERAVESAVEKPSSSKRRPAPAAVPKETPRKVSPSPAKSVPAAKVTSKVTKTAAKVSKPLPSRSDGGAEMNKQDRQRRETNAVFKEQLSKRQMMQSKQGVLIDAKLGKPVSRGVSTVIASSASYVPLIVSPVMIDSEVADNRKKKPKNASSWKNKKPQELTDDDLLAMPDEEYMNEVQLEAFRYRLQKLKNDILSSADQTTEHLREDSQLTSDPADRATIEEEHALELRARDRERKLLKKIEQALVHIDSGEYGYCDETGEPIGIPRLLARLTATLSLEAQQRRELKRKLYGN